MSGSKLAIMFGVAAALFWRGLADDGQRLAGRRMRLRFNKGLRRRRCRLGRGHGLAVARARPRGRRVRPAQADDHGLVDEPVVLGIGVAVREVEHEGEVGRGDRAQD